MDVYLDAAATAGHRGVDDVIVTTIMDAMRECWQNPSSLYSSGQMARKEIENCRENIAKFINANPEEIYFTSGASESNNMAIRGWVDEMMSQNDFFYTPINVITTPIEHKSIKKLVEEGIREAMLCYCSVDKYGSINLEELESLLGNRYGESILVSIGYANSEIGTMQNIKKISELVHKYNGVLHVDATQVLPYHRIDVDYLGIDMMSASGHKISPVLKGIGFLYKRNSVDIKPLIYGAQEKGLRGGTENTFGIVGLSEAIKWCDVSCDREFSMTMLHCYFVDKLEEEFGCKLNGHSNFRISNNINVTFPQNITGESLLYMLDMSGIAISTGSACNSKSIEPSYVLKAIGLTDEEAMKTVRFTLHDNITYEDIDNTIEEIRKAIKIIELERGDV